MNAKPTEGEERWFYCYHPGDFVSKQPTVKHLCRFQNNRWVQIGPDIKLT